MIDAPTTPVIFTAAELWMLHSFVRHEDAKQDDWKFPPVSFDLNEQIAQALLNCHRHGWTEATLLLTLHSCLVIDYWVRADFKTPEGATGIAILLKVFAARAALAGELPDAGTTDSVYDEAMRARHNQEE